MATELTDAQLARLRQSGIKLAGGRFWHEGAEVVHGGLRAALWRWLHREPDGRWVLRLDARRFVYLDVEDGVPFVVRSARWEGERALILLSDESEEELAYASLRLAPDGRPFCLVKGRFPARLATAAWQVLAERIDEEGLRAAGRHFAIESSSR